jgi:hypothetical protein
MDRLQIGREEEKDEMSHSLEWFRSRTSKQHKENTCARWAEERKDHEQDCIDVENVDNRKTFSFIRCTMD